MTTQLDLTEYGVVSEANGVSEDSLTEIYAEDYLIDRVADEELKYENFHGLDTRVLLHSSDNPLNALYQKVVDTGLSLHDRQRAFDYLYHSPYLNKESICSNALLGLLKDESLTVDDRFHFLNSIRLQSSELSVPMHGYVWWFYRANSEGGDDHRDVSDHRANSEDRDVGEGDEGEEKKTTAEDTERLTKQLRYKLLSAQFILSHPIKDFPLVKTHILQSQRFLKSTAEDLSETVQLRAEAADMLIRLGTPNFRAVGRRVIEELGGMPSKHQTLYQDEQNVHQIQYTEALKKLMNKEYKLYPIDEILHHLRSMQADAASDSLQRIVLDTAFYQGHTMSYILQCVYSYIQSSPHKTELENRFLEELVEMRGWCSTGHVVRLLNVFAGFDPELGLSVDVYAELKSSLISRLNHHLQTLPQEQQEELIAEFGAEEKGLLEEFVETYTPYEELLLEYRHLPREQFEEYYNRAVKEYTG
jgi:hypothetical protein